MSSSPRIDRLRTMRVGDIVDGIMDENMILAAGDAMVPDHKGL